MNLILFDNELLVKEGEFQEAVILSKLTTHAYPARNPAQNIADLKAQIASDRLVALEILNSKA